MSSEHGLDDDTVSELLDLSSGISTTAAVSNDLPEGTRQILIVSDHNLVAAGFVSGGNTSSQSVVILRGKPSPSSDKTLKAAYITFIPDGDKIRPPRYNKPKGTIHIWMHYRHLQTVLTQIHEGAVYCWIGHFANNHIYADIHTSH